MNLEIKICGLTVPAEALACAEAGADAIGLVFYRPSPRHLEPAQARAISDILPPSVARVGVFADADADGILRTAEAAGLTAIQLHGPRSLAALPQLLHTPYRLIAVLRTAEGLVAAARTLPETVGILVECGRGVLPGGNGAVWAWGAAAPLAAVRPFALAGGITPETAVAAIRAAQASALDISSGVEASPGRKDLSRVRLLVALLTAACADLPATSVFRSVRRGNEHAAGDPPDRTPDRAGSFGVELPLDHRRD